jgi:hypothetical protein
MTTAYTPTLKLALPVTGDLSGTWGDVVNDNITSMVEQAIAGLATIDTWTTNAHTLTTADGTTSESRCAMLVLTDSGTALSGAATVTCPTAAKLYIVKNTSGQSATIKTAAGTGIAVPNGETMFVFCDGTNVVQAVTRITSADVDFTSLTGTGAVVVTNILDEDNMASDSATALATQQSIKAYVDAQVGANDDLSEVLANGNTTGSNNIIVTAGQKITADTIDETTADSGVTIDSVLLKDDGVNATNLEITNIKANDGTASIVLADSTGVATINAAPILTALTATRAVFTDGSKALVSNAITGTGNVVMSTSPTLVTPALGTPSALVGTNITGTATAFTASNVTTNANLTGVVTSVGNATSFGSSTGSGAVVLATSPTLVTPALGTPSALVGTNITGTATAFTASNVTTNANLTGVVTSVGNATSFGSSTGSGAVVLATSPTLVTPALGTPSALVGTNITGTATAFTASNVTTNANLTGVVTSVGNATSFGSSTGSGAVVLATSPTLVTPALGTPSALVGTNITGTATAFTASNVTTNANLTGAVTSVGNAASLGSFTSTNLRTALTDETGTGSAVFATSPTLVTPALGTPASGVVTNLTGTASININGTVGATTPAAGTFTQAAFTTYTETVYAVTGTTPALSPNNGTIQTWTLSGASTPTAGTWAAGQSLTLMVDDGTAYTITWSSLSVVWKTDAGVAPTLNTSGETAIQLWKVGTTIYGARVGDA